MHRTLFLRLARPATGLLILLLSLLVTPAGQARAPLSILSAAPVTTNVMQRLQDAYLDPSRFDYQQGLHDALRAIEALVPEFQADYQPGQPTLKVQMNLVRKSFTVDYLSSLPATLDVLKKVYRFIQENLGDEIDPADVEYAASNGFLSILDPHTRLLPPDIYSEFMVQTSGSFGGIGIVIGVRDNALTVISPLDKRPASRAGIRAGDQIARIEDESTENMPLDEAVRRLRGPEGSVVHITIFRPGQASYKDYALTRETIDLPSVEAQLLPGDVGFVRVTGFQEKTARDLRDKLTQMQERAGGPEKFKGLVIDLRNNPGGLLDQAIQVADLFLDSGTIVSTVNRTSRKSERAKQFRTQPRYPIVILVNEGSASASEIVAGALKNHGRALIVGARTFGKGSVQNLFELPLGAALKMTVAQYLTPGDQSIQSVGVSPNIRLTPVEISSSEIHMARFEPRGREEKQDFHLEGIITSQIQVDADLSYYVAVEDEPPADEENAPPPEEEKKRYDDVADVDLEKDYPVDLARKIILATPGWQRQVTLEASQGLLEKERAEQEQRITLALQGHKIDWTAGHTVLPVSLETRMDVVDAKGKVLPAARAGEEQLLRLTVTNRGKTPVYQLRSETESGEPFLSHREFAIGKLAPGASGSQTIPFRLSKGAIGRTSEVDVHLLVDGGTEILETSHPVPVEARTHPQFTLSYQLFDGDAAKKTPEGNGDRQINPGETISLEVTAKNVGEGKSEGSTLRLRNLAGPLVELGGGEGTFKFGPLAPGEQAKGTVSFHLKATYLEDKLPLDLSIVDNEYGVGFAQKMELSVVRQGGAIPTMAEVERTRARTFAPPVVEVEGERRTGLEAQLEEAPIKGELRDDVRVKDFYVAVNGEKTFYRSYEAAAAERLDRFKFNVKVSLKPGANFVLLVVRDNDDLTTRYPLYVWRPRPPSAVGEAPAPREKKAKAAHP